jgi:Transcriptional Coactivator p15 (PC4)
MKRQRDKSNPIAEWPKGGGDVVRVELSQYRGHDMVGVRVWRPCRGGDDQPLKNGVNLTVKHLPKLIKALRRARKKAVEAGLLPKT